jgi:hypothetical protein
MIQEEFSGAILSREFAGFTSRMYADYLDENKRSCLHTTEDYAGYVIQQFKIFN